VVWTRKENIRRLCSKKYIRSKVG